MDKKILDGIKIGFGIIFSLSLFFGIVFAIGFHSADEILSGTFSGDFIFNGNINHNGSYIPQGFTETNGIIHSISMQTSNHYSAVDYCAQLNSNICNFAQYRIANLGWFDDIDYFAEDHLFWNGNTAWNLLNNSIKYACSLGQTVEAGKHSITEGYFIVDITSISERCSRELPYYCCK